MTYSTKKLGLVFFAGLMAANSLSGLVTTTTVSAASNCSDDAIVRCGISNFDVSAVTGVDREVLYSLKSKARKLLRENPGSIKVVWGQMYSNGVITVDGEVVAHSAESYGRNSGQGRVAVSSGNTTYYRAPASHFVPAGKSEQVFVMLSSEGEFLAANMKACGNPIDAEAVPRAVKPTPTTPTPTPTPAPTPTTPTPVKPETPVVQPVAAVTETPAPVVIASTGPADIAIKALGLGGVTALLAYLGMAIRRRF